MTTAATHNCDLAIYMHWPFCKFKCPYCDFNSHVRERVDHAAWRTALVRELEHYRALSGARHIQSVFFGGGTPSLMEAETVAAVIQTIDCLWGLPAETEVTLEANPTSIEIDKLRGFRAAGVNRVSMGVQSLVDDDLKKLGRQHTAAEALHGVETAARVFDRFSFDLIYARPGQTPDLWRQELEKALEYAGGHLSLYQLTIEPGTQYYTLHQRGELVVPDEETAAQLYELTQDIMTARGMPAYEISNHARAGEESRHNLVYWRYGDYAGIGPGAHGRLTLDGVKQATRAHRAPEVWMQKVTEQGHGAHPFEPVDFPERGREALMMGLRLTEGVPLSRLESESRQPFSSFVNPSRLKMLVDEGLLDVTAEKLKATPAGRQKLNAVLAYLLAPEGLQDV